MKKKLNTFNDFIDEHWLLQSIGYFQYILKIN